jgi:hypothetical protein
VKTRYPAAAKRNNNLGKEISEIIRKPSRIKKNSKDS